MRLPEKFWFKHSPTNKRSEQEDTQESMNYRAFLSGVPTFRQWIVDIALDVASIVAIGVLAIGLNTVDVPTHRKFYIWDESGNFVNYSIGYNRQSNIVPIWLSALLAALLPTIVFALTQLRIKSFYDLHVAFWANIWSIVIASAFQVFNKLLIGGVRPHFLDACQPDPNIRPGDGVGYHGLYFTADICTGPNKTWINDALKSWPSGHTSVAFGGFALLSLYINGHYKVFSDERPKMIKVAFFFIPLLGACLIGGAMVLDHSHHWYDVFGGAVIGLCTSFACYRANYASIFDHRFNHIPLPRPGLWRHAHGEGWTMPGNPTTVDSGKFVYSTDLTQRFPDFAHGTAMRWAPRGAPGDSLNGSLTGMQRKEPTMPSELV